MLGFGGRAVYHKKIPSGVWTLSLETGFVGCVRDLVLDGVAINLVSSSLEQDHGNISFIKPNKVQLTAVIVKNNSIFNIRD